MSNSFVVDAKAPFSATDFEEDAPYLYSRWSNPTVGQLEAKLAAMEGGETAVAFGSGMAAATGLFLHLLGRGGHLVMSDVAYAGTIELVHETIAALGIAVTTVDMSDLDEVERAIRPETQLVYTECPVNPIVRLTDLKAVADLAHRMGASFAVDSTFATPVATRPIELGADYVVHSLSKYIGGHGDVIGGAIVGRRAQIERLRRHTGIHLGGVLSPFNAWLVIRSAATLPIRMAAHASGALHVATFLEGSSRVKRVIYPGLPSHPQFELARSQMANASGILTFQVDDGERVARDLARRVKIFHYAVSLGHHRSLIFFLSTAQLLRSSFRLTARQEMRYREFAGDGIFRVSIGLEDPEDLCADLDEALGGP